MAQIQKGTTYSTNGEVTATNLNAHVDDAILLAGAITAQTDWSGALATGDSMLIHDADPAGLKEVTLGTLYGTPLDIGGTTPAAGAFTTLSASSTLGVTGTATMDGATVCNGNVTLGNAAGDTITVNGTTTFAVAPVLPAAASYDAAAYATGANTANTYQVNLSPAFTDTNLVAGATVSFKADTTNTGAVTLSLNSATDKALKYTATITLPAGAIPAGAIVTCVYDGTQFLVSGIVRPRYVSAEIPFTTDLYYEVTHGLGVVPSHVRWVMRAVDTASGTDYVAGDEVDLTAFVYGGSGDDKAWGGYYANATISRVSFRTVTEGLTNIKVYDKAGGEMVDINDLADWALVCYAEV